MQGKAKVGEEMVVKAFTILPQQKAGIRALARQLRVSESAVCRWALERLLRAAPEELRALTL